jgi:lysophospholipase L1-like esterase
MISNVQRSAATFALSYRSRLGPKVISVTYLCPYPKLRFILFFGRIFMLYSSLRCLKVTQAALLTAITVLTGSLFPYYAYSEETSLLTDVNGDGIVMIMGFGDSFTYGVGDGVTADGSIPFTDGERGYLPRLSTLTGAKVINSGYPGEHLIDDGIFRLPKAVEASNADIVILMEGYNDASLVSGAQEYRRNLQRAINVTRALGRSLILTTLVNNVEEHAFLLTSTLPYTKTVKILGAANLVPVIDLQRGWINRCSQDSSAPCPLLHSPEGLHPTPAGYDVISQITAATLLGINVFGPQGPEQLANATGVELNEIIVSPDPVQADKTAQ